MKLFSKFLFAFFAFFAVSAGAQQFISQGNSGPLFAFTGQAVTNGTSTGPNFQSNVAWYCASARGIGVPRLLSISAIGDLSPSPALAPGGINTYFSTNSTTVTNAGMSGTNMLMLADTSLFASNDIIVLRQMASDSYQRMVVTNSATNGTLMTWPSAAFATTNGDVVYKMTAAATLAVPLTYTNLGSPNGIFFGQANRPFLIDMLYSNAGSIKLISGDYFPLSYPFSR